MAKTWYNSNEGARPHDRREAILVMGFSESRFGNALPEEPEKIVMTVVKPVRSANQGG
jgi:hypothetical protein